MKRQLSPVFFLKYAWNTGRKNRFRKRLMTVVCAAAVVGGVQGFFYYKKKKAERQKAQQNENAKEGV